MSYLATILADNPIDYYRLDEASGLQAHDYITGRVTTLVHPTSYQVPGALQGSGDTDPGMGFAATGDLQPPAAFTLGNFTAFSVEFWIQLTGGWHQVVVTMSNATGQQKLYLDGAPFVSGSGDVVRIDSNLWYAGSMLVAGNLDEAIYFGYALSAAQVLTHYQSATSTTVTNAPLMQMVPTNLWVTIGGVF